MPLPPAVQEAQVLERVRAGDSAAFDSLFHQHKDAVYQLLWHLLDGKNDAVEEVVGNVFLAAYRGLGKFRGEAAFATWLYRITVREAMAYRRQYSRRLLLLDGLLTMHSQAVSAWSAVRQENNSVETDAESDPLLSLLREEDNRRLHMGLRRLPEPYRTPVILRYLSEKENREIAQILQRPEGTVRYQISRGLKLLAERLGSEWDS